jgi:hypothetical protein
MTRSAEAPTTTPPPQPSLWPLLCLVLVSVAVHGWLIANTSVTARDSIGFARYALNLGDRPPDASGTQRSLSQLLRDEKHPPGYPFAVLLASRVVRPFTTAALPDQMLFAAQLASATAAVLLVFPTYLLGRMLFTPSVGFWSSLILQLLPVLARDTSDGLSDGPFLLFVAWALVCAVGGFRSGAGLWFIGCGASAAAAYLIRPEGLAVLVGIGLAGLGMAVTRRWPWPHVFATVLTVAVGFAPLAAPYMLVIRGLTNKPALGGEAAEVRAVSGPVFAEWFPKESAGQVAAACAREWLKVGHYGAAVFAVIGGLLLANRLRTDPRFWAPLGYAATHLAVVFMLGYRKGYVSERHLLPITLIGVPLAVGGLVPWFRLWERLPKVGPVFRWPGWPAATLTGFLACCVPALLRPLHENRTGHRYAGLKLADEIDALSGEQKAGLVVIDHYEWAMFHAGWSVYRVPPDPPDDRQRVVFVVLELKDGRPDTPTVQSERHKAAIGVFRDPKNPPEWVYHWPENEPREQAKVGLFKQVR